MPGAATAVSVLILAVSGLLLLFWLRLACRSILAERAGQEYGVGVAEANQLQYLELRYTLAEEPEAIADSSEVLHELECDYQALTYLLRNAATLHVGRYSRAERLLVLDFHLLRLWVQVKRLLGLESSRGRLLEMVAILEYFGNVVGQRLVTFSSRLPAS